MMRNKTINILLVMFSFLTFVNGQSDRLEGEVSFITSDNVYVRFLNTTEISVGDTLFMESFPCLEVEKKSSTSCVCKRINECDLQIKQKVFMPLKETDNLSNSMDTLVPQKLEKADIDSALPVSVNLDKQEKENSNLQRIRGRTSLASYSSFSPFEDKDRHRVMARLSYNVERINNGKFSFYSYLNYRKNIQSGSSSTIGSSFLRIYNSSVSYQADSSLVLNFGRSINRNMASIGAVDGLHAEKRFGTILTGALIGFRPDIGTFEFNPNLFQYGFFVGSELARNKLRYRVTLGFMEQRNQGQIDRRYIHIQSVQNFSRDLNVFSSIEVDLYQFVHSTSINKPRLTNLYVSARYRLSKDLSINIAYDNRKRILLYETFKTEIEQLLDDDISRQGIRFRINYRFLRKIQTGISIARRYQSDMGNQSNNYNAFLSIRKLGHKTGNLAFRYNRNASNYLKSEIISTSYTLNTFKSRLSSQFYFRNVRYDYFSNEIKLAQNYYGTNLNFKLSKSMRLALMGEMSIRDNNNFYRLNTRLIKRFN